MEKDSKFIVEWLPLQPQLVENPKETGSLSFDDDLNDYVAEGVEAYGALQGNCN